MCKTIVFVLCCSAVKIWKMVVFDSFLKNMCRFSSQFDAYSFDVDDMRFFGYQIIYNECYVLCYIASSVVVLDVAGN